MSAANDLRSRMDELWRRIDDEAEERKDSPSAVFALEKWYISLRDEDRQAADDVLIEWALSNNDKKRFDALALINRFVIVGAVPALRRLAERLEEATLPSSPYDWAKVNRIIGRLVGHQPPTEGE